MVFRPGRQPVEMEVNPNRLSANYCLVRLLGFIQLRKGEKDSIGTDRQAQTQVGSVVLDGAFLRARMPGNPDPVIVGAPRPIPVYHHPGVRVPLSPEPPVD